MFNPDSVYRTDFSRTIAHRKYLHPEGGCDTWHGLAHCLAFEVCGAYLPRTTILAIAEAIASMKFIPGGRYLYYAGRAVRYYNNCYLLRSEEDTREDWARLAEKATSCLMTGGGIGNDYSVYRPAGSHLSRTGGISSGPLPAMELVNEIGRRVMQGGSRRSAIYASLNWRHGDAHAFLHAKDWHTRVIPGTSATYADAKGIDFNFPCPLDCTNISLNYDNAWRDGDRLHPTFMANVMQALKTGEPGFSFNFDHKQNETLRNACTEVTSEDDSDVCNLGSLNLSRIDNIAELATITELATLFLLCGTLTAALPYEKVARVREKNRRLGLGLMGVHEWLMKRNYRYEVVPELHDWLSIYRTVSTLSANEGSDRLSISRPIATRAIAPTGTIGIVAATTTGIEPLFAVAMKRRYLKGSVHHYQYVIDPIAKGMVDELGINPDSIETALDLAADPERRIKFQADVQDYVDQSISSTINLPAWGTPLNNPDTAPRFAALLSHYAPRLRGFTCYPDGARGGQPLIRVPYAEARAHEGREFVEEAIDVCSITQRGGTCGA